MTGNGYGGTDKPRLYSRRTQLVPVAVLALLLFSVLDGSIETHNHVSALSLAETLCPINEHTFL